jgi:hypothetical protein
MGEMPRQVTFALCKWMENSEICNKEFNSEQPNLFAGHLEQHVEDIVKASKELRQPISPKSRDQAESEKSGKRDAERVSVTRTQTECSF